MEDVLDLYAEPYDAHFPVVCFDERPCFLIADVLTPIPLGPGRPSRHDYEYEKRGSANVFGFLEPKTGQRHLRVTERRTKQDFAHTIDHLLTELYPDRYQSSAGARQSQHPHARCALRHLPR